MSFNASSQLAPTARCVRRDLNDELHKAQRLAAEGRCDHYIVMTNAAVTGRAEEALARRFRTAGIPDVRVYGYTWLCDVLRDNKRLRMLVPRVYGLGDLSEILDERAYAQASKLLASLQPDLGKVVLTSSYHAAATALETHGFVLLLGEPAAGKSTIAAMLALAAIDQWECPTVRIDRPVELKEHWNPNAPAQFFWIDDAFGTTQYEATRARDWTRLWPQTSAALTRGAKIVMTSRDYIYKEARDLLRIDAFPLLAESQVSIDLRALSPSEKRQMLYNHIKLGAQPSAFRSGIKPFLDAVADHPAFLPELARRLGNPTFTSRLRLDRSGVDDFVARPLDFLLDVLAALDRDSRAALALIYMAGGARSSPVALEPREADALSRLGSSLGGAIRALGHLEGSLVRHTTDIDGAFWRFKHPTIADALAQVFRTDPEHLAILVQGSPIEQLLDEVTCGDMAIQGAVILPSSLWKDMIERLDGMSNGWQQRSARNTFLTYRCTSAFLAAYLPSHPHLLKEVSNPGLFLSAVSELPLALRLHSEGLMPEAHRLRFIAAIIQQTVEGPDDYAFIHSPLRAVFSATEFAELRQAVEVDLLPHLEDAVDNWESNLPHDQAPDAYMGPLEDTLGTLAKEFPEHAAQISKARESVASWVQYRMSDYEPAASTQRKSLSASTSGPEPEGRGRSIFDDIDA